MISDTDSQRFPWQPYPKTRDVIDKEAVDMNGVADTPELRKLYEKANRMFKKEDGSRNLGIEQVKVVFSICYADI